MGDIIAVEAHIFTMDYHYTLLNILENPSNINDKTVHYWLDITEIRNTTFVSYKFNVLVEIKNITWHDRWTFKSFLTFSRYHCVRFK